MLNLTPIYNGLNEKLITIINTLDGSWLANYLIKNHKNECFQHSFQLKLLKIIKIILLL